MNGNRDQIVIGYDSKATETTRKRYQRNARFYDLMEGGAEKRHGPWRQQLWSRVKGPKVLEVGVGTGKNISYYPNGLEISAIDLTPGMLDQAKVRAQELGKPAHLSLGDVQRLVLRTRPLILSQPLLSFVLSPILSWGCRRSDACSNQVERSYCWNMSVPSSPFLAY